MTARDLLQARADAAAAEPGFCVWMKTEGLDFLPILCCAGSAATDLARRLDDARIVFLAEIWPCCRNETGDVPCPRDNFADMDDEIAQAVEVLTVAALNAGIIWPEDRAAAGDGRS